MNEKQKNFWRATAIRCARTFLTAILGCWTVGASITSVDWKETFLVAISTTVYIFLTCLVGGLPEVDQKEYLEDSKEALYYEDDDEPEDDEDEDIDEGAEPDQEL